MAATHIRATIDVAFACALLAGSMRPNRNADARALLAIIAVAFSLGTTCAMFAEHNADRVPFAALAERHVVAIASVIDRPRATSNGFSVRARILGVDAPRTAAAASLRGEVALVDLPAIDHPDRLVGRRVTVRARLSIPGGPRNDGEPAERDVLADQGVTVILGVPAARDIAIGPPQPGWEGWWARLRLASARTLEARLPPLDAIVLEGILWGDRSDLPAAVRQEFSDTGTVHVLTTAGLHLGIFAAMIGWLLARSPLPRSVRVALSLAAAWGYALVAGLHLPTLRAATMLTAGAIAHESGRGRSPSAVLAAAAYSVALPHPLVVLSPSFSMSFACVGGISLLGPVCAKMGLHEEAGVGAHVAELARTSVVVQVALWPFQALYFNAFTPWAVVANMAVVPLVGVVMAVGGLLLFAAAALPVLTAPLSNLASWALELLTGAVERFASLPHAHVDMPPPSHLFLICYWACLGTFAWAMHDPAVRARLARWSPVALLVLLLVYVAPGIAATLDSRLHVDAIDVGQADCLLVRAPGMHAMLVDGGGRLERSGAGGVVVAQPIGDVIATRTVMPFLLRHWVLHLDDVVLTHPHGDHAGGLPVILQRENVGAVWDSAQLYGGPAYRRALEVIRGRAIRYRVARRGESFDLGSATHIDILAPEMPLISGTSSDINNNSVVLRLTFGRTVVLMTGDAQAEAEGRLLSHGSADLHAAILKVGHHGSAYSSTPAFLAAVRPKFAIISCGLHNVFGHPSPRTLAALAAVGARVYRTDLDGGISVVTNGRTVSASASGRTL